MSLFDYQLIEVKTVAIMMAGYQAGLSMCFRTALLIQFVVLLKKMHK